MVVQSVIGEFSNPMRVVFRVDASLEIGTGHVMRCLTLADRLRQSGSECIFICRCHKGHLGELILERGHRLSLLPMTQKYIGISNTVANKEHAKWLGVTWEWDAEQCAAILSEELPDWLVVDHYALDARWEKLSRKHCKKILVLDDLADRRHLCDILLDQTFGRSIDDYRLQVPPTCDILCGSPYSLLRPEFEEWRNYSLKRREGFVLRSILVNLGGVDKDNITSDVLKSLKSCKLPEDCKLTVVMGSTAPWVEDVREAAACMPWATEVRVDVSNMAEIMSNSDLAIGAAGSTSWERCSLGLPSIQIVIADNQRLIGQLLSEAGASKLLENVELLYLLVDSAGGWMASVSNEAQLVTDGKGVNRLICRMINLDRQSRY